MTIYFGWVVAVCVLECGCVDGWGGRVEGGQHLQKNQFLLFVWFLGFRTQNLNCRHFEKYEMCWKKFSTCTSPTPLKFDGDKIFQQRAKKIFSKFLSCQPKESGQKVQRTVLVQFQTFFALHASLCSALDKKLSPASGHSAFFLGLCAALYLFGRHP